MIKFRRVIILTGTPGVGKTNVSKLLSKRLKALNIDLNKIVREENLTVGRDVKRETLIVDLNGLSKRVNEIVESSSQDVILEGHYASDAISPDLVSHVFLLRRDPYVLKKTLKKRGFKEAKVMENVLAEILDVCLFGAVNKYGTEKVCELDVTNRSVNEVVESILRILGGLDEPSIGKVDWIGKLEKEGRFDEFIRVL